MYSFPEGFGYNFHYIDLLFRKLADVAEVQYIKSEIENKLINEEIITFFRKKKKITRKEKSYYYVYIKTDDFEKVKQLKWYSFVVDMKNYDINVLVEFDFVNYKKFILSNKNEFYFKEIAEE
jgi:hypothetical protein